ncbi:hypothetical protein KAR91_02600 [Candidatus Pacearchaeota archaeon]|nr:hypothetical protein [Candidatus Pacearchaeota archaeon]
MQQINLKTFSFFTLPETAKDWIGFQVTPNKYFILGMFPFDEEKTRLTTFILSQEDTCYLAEFFVDTDLFKCGYYHIFEREELVFHNIINLILSYKGTPFEFEGMIDFPDSIEELATTSEIDTIEVEELSFEEAQTRYGVDENNILGLFALQKGQQVNISTPLEETEGVSFNMEVSKFVWFDATVHLCLKMPAHD